jgi:hypothetical protein
MVVVGSTFVKNSASWGGGIFAEGLDSTVNGSTLVGNVAPFAGAGIYLFNSWLTITNSNISDNSGMGIFRYEDQSPLDVLALRNCTVVGNAGAGIWNNNYFSSGFAFPAALSNCIVWGNTIAITGVGRSVVSSSDIKGGFAGAGNINADPQFVRNPSPGPDGQWGTADDDYGDLRLQFNSPCIDAGDNSAVPSGVTTDLAGKPRFVDFPGVNDPGAIVDMGAYERRPVGTIQFSTSAISVSEAAGTAQITVSRVGGSEGACSVDLLIGDGTATEGKDYVAPSTQTLSFADGEVSKTISISILEDKLFEGDETVNLSLANPTAGATLAAPDQATLTIVDDDHFDGSGRTLSLDKKKFSDVLLGSFVNTNFSSPQGLTAVIDWGDGSRSAGAVISDPSGVGFDVLGTQKYKKKGTYEAQIIITDADGAQLVLKSTITVGDKE